MLVQIQNQNTKTDQNSQQGTAAKQPTALHDFVENLAKASPFQTALEQNDQEISFQDLNNRANQVANYLIGKGVSQGDIVALHQNRSADLFICLLGISKAGAAYVLIDPDSTSSDISEICADLDPKFIVASKDLSRNITSFDSEKIIIVDENRDSFDTLSSRNRFPGSANVGPQDIAQVVLNACEGSSSEVVKIEQAEAINTIRSLSRVYGLDASQRCYQDSSLSFDVSVDEILAMLSSGATVVLEQKNANQTPEDKARFLAEQQITLCSTTPEILSEMDDELPCVNVLIIGGTKCSSELAVGWALKKQRVVSLKSEQDRFPSFSIEQEARKVLRPRLLHSTASERMAA